MAVSRRLTVHCFEGFVIDKAGPREGAEQRTPFAFMANHIMWDDVSGISLERMVRGRWLV